MQDGGRLPGRLQATDLIVAGALLLAVTAHSVALHGLPQASDGFMWCLLQGGFAAATYLAFRGIWRAFRRSTDEKDDRFFRVRFVSLCGAVVFACSPFAEQAIVRKQVGLVLFLAFTSAVVLWCMGCRCRRLAPYAVAYLIFGFASGGDPVGLLATVPFVWQDIAYRWHHGTPRGQREEDIQRKQESQVEAVVSCVAFALGLAAGLWAFGRLSFDGAFVWYTQLGKTCSSSDILGVLLAGAAYLVAPAVGRRIREQDRRGRLPGAILTALVALAALALAVRPFI